MKRIVGLGACVYDTLIECDNFPIEDTKKKVNNITVSGGGPVGNALVVASRLGRATSIVGAFADDFSGRYLIDDFKNFGVSTENVKIIKGAKSFVSYILLSQEQKSRTCLFDRGTIVDDIKNISLIAIDKSDILHLDGNYIKSAIFAAKYAREQGVLVSLDAGGLYDGIDNLLPLVDILIPSKEFALGVTGTKTIPEAMDVIFNKYQPSVLVITDGKDGGYYYENGIAVHYPSFKVNAVDTNAAGDTFHGAFLVAYMNGLSIKDCCVFASATSAYKCQYMGIRKYPLTKEIIDNFIKENARR